MGIMFTPIKKVKQKERKKQKNFKLFYMKPFYIVIDIYLLQSSHIIPTNNKYNRKMINEIEQMYRTGKLKTNK